MTRLWTLLALLLIGAPAPAADRATELLKRVDDLWRGESSHARMRMRVKTERYERQMSLEAWTLGTEKTLVRILEPKREKGTATLKSGDSIYTYLPRTDRTIKLNAGMMGGSWMGSHFTNDDLVQEARLSEDYDASITFEGARDGQQLVELTLVPKADAAVVWGKIVTLIEAESLIPKKTVYYDEDLKPARAMSFHDVRQLGGRPAPARMRMVPADKPKEFTEMSYELLELDPPMAAGLFSLQSLRKR